jgi:multidrug efflux pump subunit AcrB
VARFAGHPVAAHLVMILMILGGLLALQRMTTQFFPDFDLGTITVRTVWEGASAEDMAEGITRPLEQNLRNLDHLDNLTSTSSDSLSVITLEFAESADMGESLENVKSRVDQVRSLPANAEDPQVTRVTPYDPVATVLVYARGEGGPGSLAELRRLARDMRDELLDRGITKIDILGLPERKLAVQLPPERLWELGLTLPTVADRIRARSQELPAGEVGEDSAGRQLRSPGKRRTVTGLADLPLTSGPDSGRLELGAAADIRPLDQEDSVRLTYRGRPAVALDLKRATAGDTLEAARTLEAWLADTRPTLPPGVGLQVYDEASSLLKERIGLLVKNGLGGLVLVLGILFLFLRGRVAFWVAVGIPVSFLAALAALHAIGGSLNMISLFAFIMTLGIIVDDAIVVAEQGVARYRGGGEGALEAAANAARRMWPPVLSSSLTTVSAFIPLMLVGGTIGNILFDIPLVVVCVILASLVEAFLVLPGHLSRAFTGMERHAGHLRVQQRFNERFEAFRDGPFRRLVTGAVTYRGTTMAAALALLIAAIGLLAGGRLPFSFFPSPEGTILNANAKFVAGTPRARVDEFLAHLEETLRATEAELGGERKLVRVAVARHGGTATGRPLAGSTQGDAFGALTVELISPERRELTASDFADAWRSRIQQPAGMETFTISARQGGPPGKDVEVRLSGAGADRLKAAAEEVAEALKRYPGVSAVEDDLPYGQEQLVYRPTPEGRSLGLTEQAIGAQLRAAYAGELVQIFQDGEDAVEVRVGLPEAERGSMASLGRLPMETPNGNLVPLAGVAELSHRRGYEALRHADGRLAVTVQGEVDREVNNAGRVRASLEKEVLPGVRQRFGVESEFVGRGEDQAETLADMQTGLLLALGLIYLVLAAVFGSYAWPLVVMAAIPFGLVGALAGHWLMGLDLTVLSLFGLFGLSGIVVNNAIILVSFYRDLCAEGYGRRRALVEASSQRLRPMLLTSLTTIAGLLPLLFEDSLQAQFLIPMAVSISFGLAAGTVLVLVLVPAMLSAQQEWLHWWRHRTA